MAIRTKNIEHRAKTIIVYVPLAKAVYVLCSEWQTEQTYAPSPAGRVGVG